MTGLLAGRYRIERPLGHGGMAVVELAEDVELGRVVAIKLLADNLARDPDLRERFLREARHAARLSHPNVVRVYDVGEDAGRPYIVMEHVAGETLAELLRREGRLPAGRATELAVQACGGLAAAHAAGLVHRDVKPQNLLLRHDGTLKVADFGIARLDEATRLTRTGTVLGTAGYLAPEQALGQDVTGAADIYALGAVLYELLSGRPPRRIETLAELVPELDEPVEPVRTAAPETPVELERVVMRCLARLPQYRPASAVALAAELAAAVPDAPTKPLAVPVTRATRVAVRPAARVRRRRRPGVAVLALAAAVAVAAAAGWFAIDRPTNGAGSKPSTPAPAHAVHPVRPSADPVTQARNLSAWLRANAAG